MAQHGALLVAALYLALLAADAVFWVRPLPDPFEARARIRHDALRRAGIVPDDRRRVEVVRDEARQGHRVALPAFSEELRADPRFTRLMPLAGIARVPVVLCFENGPWLLAAADEHGFRDSAATWNTPADIVLIGDSFVHGYCVPDGQDLVGQLRARGLRARAVGYGGAGPLVELGLLREYVRPSPGSVLVWVYYEGNDLDDLLGEWRHPVLRSYLDPAYSQRLASRQADVDTLLWGYFASRDSADRARPPVPTPTLATHVRRAVLVWHLRVSLRQFRRPPLAPCCPVALMTRVLAAGQREARAAGATFVLLVIPAAERYYHPSRSGRRHLAATDSVVSGARALGIPVLDVRTLLVATGDPRRFYPYETAHFSPAGYGAVAEFLQAGLARLEHAAQDAQPSKR